MTQAQLQQQQLGSIQSQPGDGSGAEQGSAGTGSVCPLLEVMRGVGDRADGGRGMGVALSKRRALSI